MQRDRGKQMFVTRLHLPRLLQPDREAWSCRKKNSVTDEDSGERREINEREAGRCNYIKDDGVVDERVMEE